MHFNRKRSQLPARVVAHQTRAPRAFAEDGDCAVKDEEGVGRASDAVGATCGRADGERDAVDFDGDDGGIAPVLAATEKEMRADLERAERERVFGRRRGGEVAV